MARSRSRLRLAFDLALAAREALERRVIEADARIGELERELACAQDCAFGAEQLAEVFRLQAEAARDAGAQVLDVGVTRDGRLGLLMEGHR